MRNGATLALASSVCRFLRSLARLRSARHSSDARARERPRGRALGAAPATYLLLRACRASAKGWWGSSGVGWPMRAREYFDFERPAAPRRLSAGTRLPGDLLVWPRGSSQHNPSKKAGDFAPTLEGSGQSRFIRHDRSCLLRCRCHRWYRCYEHGGQPKVLEHDWRFGHHRHARCKQHHFWQQQQCSNARRAGGSFVGHERVHGLSASLRSWPRTIWRSLPHAAS